MQTPPHFPDPSANPIAQLEAALAEKDEIIAAQYAEMKGWREQLERALARLADAELARDQMLEAAEAWRAHCKKMAGV